MRHVRDLVLAVLVLAVIGMIGVKASGEPLSTPGSSTFGEVTKKPFKVIGSWGRYEQAGCSGAWVGKGLMVIKRKGKVCLQKCTVDEYTTWSGDADSFEMVWTYLDRQAIWKGSMTTKKHMEGVFEIYEGGELLGTGCWRAEKGKKACPGGCK